MHQYEDKKINRNRDKLYQYFSLKEINSSVKLYFYFYFFFWHLRPLHIY